MHDERFRNLVRRYYYSGVKDITNMSLDQFVNETPATIESLIEVCLEITNAKKKHTDSITEDITNLGKT